MGQRSSPQPYLRVMAQEIQWEGAQVTNNTALQDILSPEHAQWTALSDRSWSVVLHGRRFKVEVEKGPDAEGNATVRINGVRKDIRVLDERTQLLEKMGMSVVSSAAAGDVHAPMPGKVLQVLVEPGLAVEEGQPLLVLEAMKMENVIKATAAGAVSEVPVHEGDAVEKGSLLVGFEL